MTAARIIVWRHGRTEWNHTKRFQGQADVPLDAVGRRQAAAAAEVLAEMAPDRIVASDLSRAAATAAALGERCHLPVETDQRLREIHVGSWQGLTVAEVKATDPDLAARYLAGEDVPRSPTGETVGQTAERVSAVLSEMGESAPDGSTVVVATHGVAGRVGACRLVGLPPDAWHLLGGLHNCGWIRIDRQRRGYWRIGEYNVSARVPGTRAEGPGS